MAKKVLVLLAEGFEEVEAITPIDYLRRAGIEVTTASIGKDLNVKSARNIQVLAETSLDSLLEEGKLKGANWDGVVVPGGLPGSDNLAASTETGTFLKEMAAADKLVAAICAAPARVLSPLGLLAGKKFTCYPGEEAKVTAGGSASAAAQWKEDRVVVDGNIITSRGAGTAGEFACAIVAALVNEAEAKTLAEKVLLKV
ncbi:MAG: DJ-1/PfpI family protein [Treponema sp.]|nr:DJ-1/PfpI family protein [Treponema sp.]